MNDFPDNRVGGEGDFLGFSSSPLPPLLIRVAEGWETLGGGWHEGADNQKGSHH